MIKRIVMWIMGRCMKYLMIKDKKWTDNHFEEFKECAWDVWHTEDVQGKEDWRK